jgi:L-asparaginase
MKIHVFCVGGNNDKIYLDAKSKYEVGAPAIRKMLLQIAVNLDIEVTSLMAKDSLEMTDEDRAIIAQAVEGCEADKIIITHGTDTMPETATALQGITDKTIVLVGAMQPARFRDSDALFNSGFAVAAARVFPLGGYVAMNGQIFNANQVQKNREAGLFETK